MRRLAKVARATYGRHLEDEETVLIATAATAAGTGKAIGLGAVAGILAGAIYAIAVDSPLVPALVLGLFTGVIVGAFAAARRARSPRGPGATLVQLIMTDRRLLFLRQRSALRFKPLRTFALGKVDHIDSARSPIGSYHRIAIYLTDGTTVRFHTRDGSDLAAVHREHTSRNRVD